MNLNEFIQNLNRLDSDLPYHVKKEIVLAIKHYHIKKHPLVSLDKICKDIFQFKVDDVFIHKSNISDPQLMHDVIFILEKNNINIKNGV